ncbi:MAG: IPT/TIG domain-containing protein [Candidatus Sulfotelmatobacter sp.]|jgi:outer membrane protein assembly factor BamB
MRRVAYCAIALLSLLCPLILSRAQAQVSVTTHHNDVGRTGQNLNETILNTSNVNVNQFGKLFACQVHGYVYAQPLYVAQVTISSALHNVVYVATENNSVYAFDADNGAQLWHVNLGTPVPSTDVSSTYKDLTPVIGITGTPVIDPVSSTLYVVAKTKNTSNSTYHQNLHAVDITSGAEMPGSPVEITASVAGSGSGSSGGTIAFQPLYQLNRPGLLLLNGVVYIAFGSHGDIGPYHGWVLGYSASTLAQMAVFNTTPNGSEGAIWQGGQGLVADTDNIYFMTGNGSFDANTGGTEYGDSVVKLATSMGLSVSDYFTPDNQGSLNQSDADLGSGGPILLPGTSSIVGGGKDGILRLINTASMGEYNSVLNADLQEFQATSGKIMIGPIYWNSPNHGPVVYLWGPGDYLKAFEFLNGSFQTTPISQSTMTNPAGNSNAAPLSLSANGSTSGTGIVWAALSYSGDSNQQTVTGILRAFDATNLTTELWDSQKNATRDSVGNYAKFAPPTIANGKVYLATFSNQLLVYGLVPPAALSLTSVSPTSGGTAGGTKVTIAGSGFQSGARVAFGGNAATNVKVVSTTSITATTPAHAAGTVSVTVTNPNGQSATLLNAFTYKRKKR